MDNQFLDLEDKRAFLQSASLCSTTIKLAEPMPCRTQQCLNPALVGAVTWAPTRACWELTAICKECTQRIYRLYGLDRQE
jgi:hypothetical protein